MTTQELKELEHLTRISDDPAWMLSKEEKERLLELLMKRAKQKEKGLPK